MQASTQEMITPTIFGSKSGVLSGFTTRDFFGRDEEIDVVRERLRKQTGFQELASAGQVHGCEVAVVSRPGHVWATDGLVTDRTDLLLTVVSADCALVLLADCESGILGAFHSGWRGTVEEISLVTVGIMRGLGARPANIRAYVSPCISSAAFEVGEEVAEQFDSAVVLRKPEWQRPHVNLKAELHRQLVQAGLNGENIEMDGACTASDTKRFYSYRAEGGTSGRMIGFIGLLGNGSGQSRC